MLIRLHQHSSHSMGQRRYRIPSEGPTWWIRTSGGLLRFECAKRRKVVEPFHWNVYAERFVANKDINSNKYQFYRSLIENECDAMAGTASNTCVIQYLFEMGRLTTLGSTFKLKNGSSICPALSHVVHSMRRGMASVRPATGYDVPLNGFNDINWQKKHHLILHHSQIVFDYGDSPSHDWLSSSAQPLLSPFIIYESIFSYVCVCVWCVVCVCISLLGPFFSLAIPISGMWKRQAANDNT